MSEQSTECWCDDSTLQACNITCGRLRALRQFRSATQALAAANAGDQNEDEFHEALDALFALLDEQERSS